MRWCVLNRQRHDVRVSVPRLRRGVHRQRYWRLCLLSVWRWPVLVIDHRVHSV